MKSEYLHKRWQEVMPPIVGKADLIIIDPIYDSPDTSWAYDSYVCLRPGGSLYVFSDCSGNMRLRPKIEQGLGFDFQNWLIWGPNDWGGRPKNRWAQKHDDILFFTKPGASHTFNADAVAVPKKMTGMPFNPSGRTTKIPHSVWNDLAGFSTMSKERIKIDGKVAPWQKPERVMERIILASSNPGDLVLDFFGGVATVSVVCKRLGRHCIATESDSKVYEAGKKRLSVAGVA